MKLLSVNLARSLWVVPYIDLNPRGRSLYPIVPLLVDRYKFLKPPQKPEDFDQHQGIKFHEGTYINAQGDSILVNLTILNDALVADTRSSTADCDGFLTDGLAWLAGEHGLSFSEKMVRLRAYVSEVYVSTEYPLRFLNPKLAGFEKLLSSQVSGYGDISYELAAISFGADPKGMIKLAPFRLERAEGVPFSENRYYSAAPLQTEKHLEMLAELERILAG